MRRLVHILSVLAGVALILWEVLGDHAARPWLFTLAFVLLTGPAAAVIDRGTRRRPTGGFPSALELARRDHLGGPLDEPDWPAFEAAVWAILHWTPHQQSSPPPRPGGYITLPPDTTAYDSVTFDGYGRVVAFRLERGGMDTRGELR